MSKPGMSDGVTTEAGRALKSRHELHGHSTPVLTCPVCIWLLARERVEKKRAGR